MWCVVGDNEEVLASFPAGRDGWRRAVRWATENGGELGIVFLAHMRPGWATRSGGRYRWFDKEAA